jgi:Nucleotide-diphospho-sugar transferase
MEQGETVSLRRRAEIRELEVSPLHWHSDFDHARLPLHNLDSVVDLRVLARLADNVQRDRCLCITFISQEYLGVGVRWIEAMRRLDVDNYVIIAGDSATHEFLKGVGVASIEARIDIRNISLSYRSPFGFTAKGLGINALKFPVVNALLKEGYDVVMSDADALWLQNPMPYFPLAIDVAFQRVVYFPRSIVVEWGFAACSGFVFFRSKPCVASFVDHCIREHRTVQSDQLALNLALLDADTCWPTPGASDRPVSQSNLQQDELNILFEAAARNSIVGRVNRYGFNVLALPHREFWRHSFVRCHRSEMVICHPNSPKNDQEKIEAFRHINP